MYTYTPSFPIFVCSFMWWEHIIHCWPHPLPLPFSLTDTVSWISFPISTNLSCSFFPSFYCRPGFKFQLQGPEKVPASVFSLEHWESEHLLREMSEILSVEGLVQCQAHSDAQWLWAVNIPFPCGILGRLGLCDRRCGTVESDQPKFNSCPQISCTRDMVFHRGTHTFLY